MGFAWIAVAFGGGFAPPAFVFPSGLFSGAALIMLAALGAGDAVGERAGAAGWGGGSPVHIQLPRVSSFRLDLLCPKLDHKQHFLSINPRDYK